MLGGIGSGLRGGDGRASGEWDPAVESCMLGDGGWLVLAVRYGALEGPGVGSDAGASVCWAWSVITSIDKLQILSDKRGTPTKTKLGLVI